MKVYTYSQARQSLAALLEEARKKGAVRIRRRDGQTFVVRSEVSRESPLDVPAVRVRLSRQDIVQAVRESRRSH
jgi:hypothetical protein